MAEDFGTPVVPDEGKKSNTLLIVVIVLVVLCCCCCLASTGLFYGTEPLMEFLGMDIPWY